MLFISLLIALVGVYLLQYFLYKKFAFHNVRYTVEAGRGKYSKMMRSIYTKKSPMTNGFLCRM